MFRHGHVVRPVAVSKIVDDPEGYFRQFVPQDDPLLQELEAEAEAENIPIVGPVLGELLFVLARAIDAGAILELGTATGYSAIFLARACALNGGMLTTLEHDSSLAVRASENLKRADLAKHANVICGDAFAHLSQMEGGFDLIFLDIEKVDYARALPECQRLLRPRGLLVADNVAFPAAEPFNRAIFSDDGWRPVSLFAFLPGHSRKETGCALRCAASRNALALRVLAASGLGLRARAASAWVDPAAAPGRRGLTDRAPRRRRPPRACAARARSSAAPSPTNAEPCIVAHTRGCQGGQPLEAGARLRSPRHVPVHGVSRELSSIARMAGDAALLVVAATSPAVVQQVRAEEDAGRLVVEVAGVPPVRQVRRGQEAQAVRAGRATSRRRRAAAPCQRRSR